MTTPRLTHLEDWSLPRRNRAAHKGDFGRVLILAGSIGYTGAPVFAARAAVRAGAGLVSLGVPEEIYPMACMKCDEAMPFPLPGERDLLHRAEGCQAVLAGPGLGQGPQAERLVLRLVEELPVPLVLDADGINLISRHIHVLKHRTAPTILTPHEGEFQRLTGCGLPLKDRLEQAIAFAGEFPACILVLKGMGTLTVSVRACFQNTTGNPGMAKGGSGEVLSGLIAGLLPQKQLGRFSLEELCALAVCVHGYAGDLCAEALGEYAMTPTDLLQALPQAMHRLESAQEGESAHDPLP